MTENAIYNHTYISFSEKHNAFLRQYFGTEKEVKEVQPNFANAEMLARALNNKINVVIMPADLLLLALARGLFINAIVIYFHHNVAHNIDTHTATVLRLHGHNTEIVFSVKL